MSPEVADRSVFLTFLRSMRTDLENCRADWENPNLPVFLEAMEAWIKDMDGFYANRGVTPPAEPTWQMFADILYGARVYE